MSDRLVIRMTSGPAAANVCGYYGNDEKIYHQLCIDWSFDSIHFKFKDQPWITLSIGPKQPKDEIRLITDEMSTIFKSLCFYALNNSNYYPDISITVLNELRRIVDIFV